MDKENKISEFKISKTFCFHIRDFCWPISGQQRPIAGFDGENQSVLAGPGHGGETSPDLVVTGNRDPMSMDDLTQTAGIGCRQTW